MARGYRPKGWRRIAGAVWRGPNDPQIYGQVDLEASAVEAFITRAKALGHPLTPTHLVGRAIAHALAEVPEINVRLVGGRLVPRPSVDIFFITAVGGGRDLTGVKVVAADKKTAVSLAPEVAQRAADLRSGRDPSLARSKHFMERLPLSVLRVTLRLVAWAVGAHAWSVPWLGLEASPFGSAMVSAVGSFGLPAGFSPLAWLYHVPLLVLVGELAHKPWAVDGRVEVRPVLPIAVTLDHRYVDGWHVSQLARHLRAYLADPARFEPELLPAELVPPPPQPALPSESRISRSK